MEQETYQKSRAYKRIESYYNLATRNSMYSVIMIDVMMVVLPVMAIMYIIEILNGNPENVYGLYGLISLLACTILISFLSHCVSIQANRNEIAWAENQIGELNGSDKSNRVYSRIWVSILNAFNYASWCMFVISFMAFFIIIFG